MELIMSTKISIPFMQISLLLIVSTLFLLFGKVKLALITNYLFSFYWGFGANFGKAGLLSPDILPWFSFSYLLFGLIIVILFLGSSLFSDVVGTAGLEVELFDRQLFK